MKITASKKVVCATGSGEDMLAEFKDKLANLDDTISSATNTSNVTVKPEPEVIESAVESIESITQRILDKMSESGFDPNCEPVKRYAEAAADLLAYSDDEYVDVDEWWTDTLMNYPEDIDALNDCMIASAEEIQDDGSTEDKPDEYITALMDRVSNAISSDKDITYDVKESCIACYVSSGDIIEEYEVPLEDLSYSDLDGDAEYIASAIEDDAEGIEAVEASVNDDEWGSWDPDYAEMYEEIASKQVPDASGFYTDYTMYKNVDTDEFVFVFGDKDIYRPEDGEFDWECDSEEEAWDWFNDYNGFAEDDVYSATDVMCDSYEADEKTAVKCATLTEDQIDTVYEIAEMYNTSTPVSGDWETETVHEQAAIADALGISAEEAMDVMIKYLGFDYSDFNASPAYTDEI